MAPVYKAVVRLSTGEFGDRGAIEPQRPVLSVENGITTYDPNYAVVVVSRIPDPRTQKWDGSAVVAKAQVEIDAYDAAQKDAKAIHIDDDLLIQAVAQLDFEERQKLQVRNGQTLRTAAECKARIKTIYRSLL